MGMTEGYFVTGMSIARPDDLAGDIIVALKGETGLTNTNLATVRGILAGAPPGGLSITERLEWARTRVATVDLKAFHAALADAGGCALTYTAARKYHAGRTPPTEYLVAVTRAFGVSLWWLATGETD